MRTAVLEAARAAMAEDGPRAFSLADVATRAGVHHTSIYRRWKTREALALDAWLDLSGRALPLPDTGSLEGDFALFLDALRALLVTPLARNALVLASGLDDEASRGVRSAFWSERFSAAGEMVETARRRGEIPQDTDAEQALEWLIAPLYLRLLVTGKPLEGFDVKAAAQRVTSACRTGLVMQQA
ncbi:MAG: TetR/AcrR family transcriptional regulator [Notoacmeibacter sp.]|nr:TetR/AcrR family transcriptional regulator [Notoacmeibacter sp.]